MEKQILSPQQLMIIVEVVRKDSFPNAVALVQGLTGLYVLPPNSLWLLQQAERVAREKNIKEYIRELR